MTYVLKKLYDSYHYFFYELKGEEQKVCDRKKINPKIVCSFWFCVTADERSEKFFLLENPPILMAMLLTSYVLLVRWGPQLMKDRKPFELKYVMMLYNLIQILINGIVSLMVSSLLCLIFMGLWDKLNSLKSKLLKFE